MKRYLGALALTLGVEALVVAGLSRGGTRARFVRTSLFVNLFTHPLANLVFDAFSGSTAAFVVIELAVVHVEAALYAGIERCGLWRAAGLSLAANAASLALTPLLA